MKNMVGTIKLMVARIFFGEDGEDIGAGCQGHPARLSSSSQRTEGPACHHGKERGHQDGALDQVCHGINGDRVERKNDQRNLAGGAARRGCEMR